MPLYEYRCPHCEHAFDLRQGFDSPSESDCPRCGKLARRHISAVPVIFKGTGWYVTDYAKTNSTIGTGESSNGRAGTKGGDKAADEQKSKATEAPSSSTTTTETKSTETASKG